MANKKTPTQQVKSYKRWSRVCFGGEFVSVFAPFITIGIINYEKYFIQYNGTKVSIGFLIAMAIMGIATWLVAKKEFTASFITLFVGWGAVTGVLWLIEELLADIVYIMFFGWLGIGGAMGLNFAKSKLNTEANKVKTAIDKAKEQEIMEDYKEEVAAKKENHKVKF